MKTKTFRNALNKSKGKTLFCRKLLQNASLSSDEKERSQNLPTVDTDTYLKEVEMAEGKCGLSPPEHYNLTERVEMIEQTAYSFIKRLKIWCRNGFNVL